MTKPSQSSNQPKLTHDNVREIKKRIAQGERQWSIAADYDVARQTISRIKLEINHKNIK